MAGEIVTQRIITIAATLTMGSVVVVLGCGTDPDRDGGMAPATLGAGTDADGGADGGADTEGGGGSDGAGEASSDGDAGGSGSDGLKLDVGAPADTDEACSSDDLCCLMDGEVPPHTLLEAFLAAYPVANMPATLDEVQAFDPVADGHGMTWSDAKSGGEFIDPEHGGVTVANLQAGLGVSREAAEEEMPMGSVVLAVREDAPAIHNPGNAASCVNSGGNVGAPGIGWAWGSILFEAPDGAIRELVYLYMGLCVGTADTEVYFYSDEAVEICAPPA